MNMWQQVGCYLLVIYCVARTAYCHLAPHGSVLRVLGDCMDCGAATTGCHVICKCGAISEHCFGTGFVGALIWRTEHKEKIDEQSSRLNRLKEH